VSDRWLSTALSPPSTYSLTRQRHPASHVGLRCSQASITIENGGGRAQAVCPGITVIRARRNNVSCNVALSETKQGNKCRKFGDSTRRVLRVIMSFVLATEADARAL